MCAPQLIINVETLRILRIKHIQVFWLIMVSIMSSIKWRFRSLSCESMIFMLKSSPLKHLVHGPCTSLPYKMNTLITWWKNIFTIKKTISSPLIVLSNLKTKSILMLSQGLWGIGRGWYKLELKEDSLALWPIPQHSTYLLTSLYKLDQ